MSNIEWTDKTWNPVAGCTRVSRGCDNCYAVRESKRLAKIGATKQKYGGLVNEGKNHFNGMVRMDFEALSKPLHWRRPRKVFVNSMSDLFHEQVADGFITAVFAIMALCPQHTFQILTKRPERMNEYLNRSIGDMTKHWVLGKAWEILGHHPHYDHHKLNGREWPLPNVWLGVSVEDQEAADTRIPWLLKCPAAVRWLSCEPLLGPVDLSSYLNILDRQKAGLERDPMAAAMLQQGMDDGRAFAPTMINWIVAGGESGPGARPMHPHWARLLRDQALDASVPFLFKQWGAWAPVHELQCNEPGVKGRTWYNFDPDTAVCRLGKKKTGRLLDGIEWNQYPDQ